ncbi:MAG TPA: hydrogenase maturation nickel metallochaperone HypA [Dehalococcoidia bacterium]|nr:hydrogenase maturation nickel metallochaperone HypA [Dehalococcoidia bacterium]
MTIAREIAERVTRAAEKANARSVVSVELEIGDLAFLDPVNMQMWVGQALVGGPAEGASVKIDAVASTLTCAGCGFEGPPEVPEYHDHHLPLPPLSCPRCGSADTRIEAKRDCILKRIELEV